MKTAKEMYDYTVVNKYGTVTTKKATQKHFEVIEEQLHNDENVLMSFAGLHEEPNSSFTGSFAYAITNKRLIIAQKGVLGRSKTKSVLMEHLNDVSVQNGIMWRNIKIDTLKDTFVIKNNTNSSKDLGTKVQETIFKLKKGLQNI